MKISLEQFKKEVSATNSAIINHYKPFEKPNRQLVHDGIVNLEKYYNSPIRIMWILKEPYDNKQNEGGGWSLAHSLNKGKLGKGRDAGTWQPIIYTTYGILNNYTKFENMPKIGTTNDMSLIMQNTAFINVQKLPAKTRTSNVSLKDAYIRNKEILINQISTYRPHIVIGGKTLHLFKDDLKISKDDELEFGHFSKDRILFINTYHPAQTKIKKSEYVNLIVERAKNWKYIYSKEMK